MKTSPLLHVLRPLAVLCGVIGFSLTATAISFPTNYAGNGVNNNWSTTANWNPASTPQNNTNLTFSVHNGSTSTRTATNDILNSITSITFGGQSFILNGNAITLGAGGITNNSALEQTVSFASITLGSGQTWTANTGDLTVSSDILLADHYLNIAGSFDTTLGNISGAGVNSRVTKTGSGTLTITGTASHAGFTIVDGGVLAVEGDITASANTYVGNTNGSASLTITHGGSITNGSGTLGVNVASTGNTVTVENENSTWASTGDLNVGYAGGDNTLTVTDQGTVSADYIKIGGLATATGNTVNVSDVGVLTATNDLIVGYGSADNTLNITDGGEVSNVNGFVGFAAGADDNEVMVEGENSLWANSGHLFVGASTASGNVLTVAQGGKVTVAGSTRDTIIGEADGAEFNVVTVAGPDARLENSDSGTIYIGKGGSSNELNIEAGGYVSGKNARIGFASTANGNTVKVSGTGSTWSNTGTLRVGSDGSGNALTIEDGGSVSFTGNVFVGYGADASGNAITVNGTGASLSAGTLTIGLSGTGSDVTVKNGGSLSTTTISIATNAGSSGTLNIGTGSGAGTITATSITGGAGTAAVVFNHTDAGHVFGTTLAGSLSVTLQSSGVTKLTGANTYTGNTDIQTGATLLVNNTSGSGTGTGDVTVDAGGTLGGTGTIAGDVFASGIIAVGDGGAGLLTVGSITWNGSADNAWQFDLGGESDKLMTSSFLKGGGTEFVFDFQGTSLVGTTTLVEWSDSSTFVFGDFSYINLGSGLTGVFSIDGSQLNFTAAAVPEPAAYAAIAGLVILGVAICRRRKAS